MKSETEEKVPQVGPLTPGPQPTAGFHPVETGRYVLITKMIEELETTVRHWIKLRATGAIIVGDPRLGKTTGRDYLISTLGQHFEGPAIASTTCQYTKQPSEDAFFTHLLSDVRHPVPEQGKASAKRRRLTEHLINLGTKSGRNHVVLFVDDAQLLHEAQYSWLMDVHNELNQARIDLSTFLFGQKELFSQRSSFQGARKAHLLGRFMVHDFTFNGLIDVAAMTHSLMCYDEASEFPQGSGCSFTKHYFADAFAVGWRLASIASELWQEFMEITAKHALSRFEEVPMQYFARTVDTILKTIGPESGVSPRISRAHLNKIIMEVGYADFRKNGIQDDAAA